MNCQPLVPFILDTYLCIRCTRLEIDSYSTKYNFQYYSMLKSWRLYSLREPFARNSWLTSKPRARRRMKPSAFFSNVLLKNTTTASQSNNTGVPSSTRTTLFGKRWARVIWWPWTPTGKIVGLWGRKRQSQSSNLCRRPSSWRWTRWSPQ